MNSWHLLQIIANCKTMQQDSRSSIQKYAVSLSKFIEISDTPITIGLQGEWGTGKTSLMSLYFLKELLNEFW